MTAANHPTQVVTRSISVPPDRLRKLRPEVVAELAESIRTLGLLQPIGVRTWRSGYRLVFGWHRLEAHRQLKNDTIRAVVLDGMDADAAAFGEIDENLVRADLSPAERALHLAGRKRLYEKLHPQTKHGGDRKSGRSSSQNENLKSFTADTAQKTGKGRSSIARDVTRASKVVVLADIVGTALDEGAEIDALAKLPEAEQRKLVARVKAGERVTAKHVAVKLRRESREQELAAATEAASQALGEKVYGVILADPPWKFVTSIANTTVADNHYPCMSTEQIKALPVPSADDCVLFLWATVPMLDQNIDVLKAWGFTYKSAIIWKKDRSGTGYWSLNTVEILLIGTRGNVPAPTPGEQPPQVIEAPRGRHSEKPAVFTEMIERLYPNTPKIEMFARAARAGWDVWGNEAPTSEAAQ